MTRDDPPRAFPRVLGAGALAAVAVVVLALTAPIVTQAFGGPRAITEKELLAIKELGWWNNYVKFTPAKAASDTGARYGKKGNEGTKYVLIPVGDRLLFASARVDDRPAEHVGQLTSYGGTEGEVLQRIGKPPNLMPFMLQSVRSIWVDTVAILVVAGGCLIGAVVLTVQAMKLSRPARPAPD